MNLFKRLGLYPKELMARTFNPAAINAAFARPSNASAAGFKKAADGSVFMKDPFGFLGGYNVPLPDELKAKAGTIYPSGMQLITQPLWDSKTFTTASTTQLSFFNAATSGITGNMDLAGALSFPTSFIVRAIRFIPQLSNSYQATAAVVNAFQ